jgi:hypothetical protein
MSKLRRSAGQLGGDNKEISRLTYSCGDPKVLDQDMAIMIQRPEQSGRLDRMIKPDQTRNP